MTAANELGAAAAARALAGGELAPGAVIEACLSRIAAREGAVGAWEYFEAGRVRDEARRGRRGPLAGIPVGVKDIIDTAEMPTAYGSPIYEGHRPGWDAASVALVRRAGGVVMGKTVTTEFAYFRPGRTANPRNLEHTPGGSSSGSAAAVADGMVPLAFGTQTAGSIIRPASFCGIVGYKPSFDSFSLAGIKPFAPSLDTLGVLARSVEDAALMHDVQLARTPEPFRPAAGRVRIGLCRTPWWNFAEPATQEALVSAGKLAERGGIIVEEFALPAEFEGLVETQKTVMAFEAARNLAYEHDRFADKLSPQLRELLESGLAISAGDYIAALTRTAEAKAQLARLLAGWDALLVPSAPGEAPRGLDATGDPVFCRAWTLLHLPEINLPGLKGPQGLPVGVQLVGRFMEDDRLLAVAARIEPLLRQGQA